eukprot:COSAG05_NODE_1656_length_4329_cov_15.816548_3_plen_43_part_00
MKMDLGDGTTMAKFSCCVTKPDRKGLMRRLNTRKYSSLQRQV